MKQSKEIIQERQNAILSILKTKGMIFVEQLSQELEVSEPTIRRDLADLSERGFLVRFHGGARLNEESLPVQDYASRSPASADRKILIAKTASRYVKPGDTVFLNAGTTTLEVIKLLKDMQVTIVTNNAASIPLFSDAAAELISTGGEYNKKNRSFSGNFASGIINQLYSNVTILGINGISASNGLTTAYYPETLMNSYFLRNSKGLKLIVCDGSKFGKTYTFSSGVVRDVNAVITDSSADEGEVSAIRASGVDVVIIDG